MTLPHRQPVTLAVVASIVLVLSLLMGIIAIGGSYFLTIHTNDVRQQQEVQQGQKELHKLCYTLNDLASLQPPKGNRRAIPAAPT